MNMEKLEIQKDLNVKRITKWRRELMKKASLVLVFFASGATMSFAQTTDIYDSLTQTPQQQFEYITQNLNLSEVNTGFLVDKALPMVPIEKFNGQQLSNDNRGSTFKFCKLYAMLSSMGISSNFNLPHPSSYTSLVENPQNSQILMGVLMYEYNQFREDALTQNLLTTNGVQFFDVPGRPQSPYLEKEVFLASPMKQRVAGLIQEFKLPSALVYTNSTKTIASIEMDFDDGMGFRNVIIDQGVSISYSQEGLKTIKTRITYTDSSSVIAQGLIQVVDISLAKYNWATDEGETPDMELELVAETPYLGEYGRANITVMLACGHQRILKPLIWVEGFNPAVSDLPIPYGYNLSLIHI